MGIFGNQLKAARGLIDISQPTLAQEAGITEQTLRKMEATGFKPVQGRTATMQAVLDALGRHGVAILPRGAILTTMPHE
jgi:predicted transcriptional regulator